MLSESTKLRGILMAARTGNVPVGPSMKPEEKNVLLVLYQSPIITNHGFRKKQAFS